MNNPSTARSITRRLVSIGAVDRLLYREVSARAQSEGSSVIIELIKADAIDDETVADYLSAWMNLPRLRLSAISHFDRGVALNCNLNDELQHRFLFCPLARLSDGSVAVAVVDPLWDKALEMMRLHCGELLSFYVVGWTELLHLIEDAPPAPDEVEDEVTQIEPLDERVLELARAIQLHNQRGGDSVFAFPGVPPSGDGSSKEYGSVSSDARFALLHHEDHEASEEDAAEKEKGEEVAAPLRRVTDPSARKPLAEVNLAEQAFESLPSIQAVFSLVERSIANADSGDAVWSDIHDCASLLCSATVRGVRHGDDVQLMSSRVFGAQPPEMIVEALESLVRPHLDAVSQPRHDRIVFAPQTRLEEDFVTLHGEEALLVRLPDGNDDVMFFLAMGLADEFRASFGSHIQQLLTRVEDYEPLLFDDVESR